MSNVESFEITLEVSRTDNDDVVSFKVPVPSKNSRVLDALLYVRHNVDPSLGFRYSCRAGMCGSCAVVVNGKESSACSACYYNEKNKLIVSPKNLSAPTHHVMNNLLISIIIKDIWLTNLQMRFPIIPGRSSLLEIRKWERHQSPIVSVTISSMKSINQAKTSNSNARILLYHQLTNGPSCIYGIH